MHHRDERPAELPEPSVADLIATERAAYRRHEAACDLCERNLDDEPLARQERTAGAAQMTAFVTAMSATPATSDDAIAMIGLFREREMELINQPVSEHLEQLFAGVQRFLADPATPRRIKADRTPTVAEAAAIDFEPWQDEEDGSALPTSERYAELAVSTRIAWRLLFMTKSSMVQKIQAMDDEIHAELFDELNRAADLLTSLSQIVSTASARFLSASAAVVVEPERRAA